MHYDEIPNLPVIANEKVHSFDQSKALEEFAQSKCKLMFYDTDKGEARLLFEKLDAALYAALVAKLSGPAYTEVYEFLKLALEGTRLIRQQTKKGYENAVRIEKHLRDKYQGRR